MNNGLKMMMAAIATLAFMAFIAPQEQKLGAPWNIPDTYKKMKNPHKGDASLIKLGKTAWAKHCRSCHGNTGLGDGPRANTLKTFSGDFSKEDFQKLSDGEIYYMSFFGRDEMPNFEKPIPDEEERWAIVNFIRTLKK